MITKQRRQTPFLLLLAILVTLVLVGARQMVSRASAAPAAATQLFYPAVYKGFGAGSTMLNSSLAIQNLGQANANVAVQFYTPQGQPAGSTNQVIPVGDSILLNMEQMGAPPQASAVVTGDQPLAGVSWVRGQGNTASHGIHTAVDPHTATMAYVPWVALSQPGSGGYTSNPVIQNLSNSQPTQVQLRFYNANGAQVGQFVTPLLPPLASSFLDPSQFGLPVPFNGAMVAESLNPNTPIAVVDNKLGGASGFTLLSHNGLPAGANTLYAENLTTQFSFSAALYVQNTHPNQAATVALTHSDNIGDTQVMIPPQSAVTVNYDPNSHPGPFTVQLASNVPIAAIIVQEHPDGRGFAVEATAGGTSAIALPLLLKNAQPVNSSPPFNSGISLLNTGSSQAQVLLRYSNGAQRQDFLPPNQVMGIGTASQNELPNQFIGSALVSASQPLLARGAVIPAQNTQGDYMAVYRGIFLPAPGVTIRKQASGQYFKNGDTITYTLSVSVGESGGSAVITDDLPDELTNTSYTASDGLLLTLRQGPDYAWDAEVPAGGGVITIIGTLDSPEDRGVTNVATIEGDAGSATSSATLVLDVTPPNTMLDSQPSNPDNNPTAEFSFTGDDSNAQGTGSGVVSFECQVDGGGFTPCTSPHTTAALSDGQHTFAVRAIDRVGHADPTPASYTWTIDTTAPPAPALISPANNSTLEDVQSATLTWQAPSDSDVAGYVVKFNGQETDVGNTTSHLVTGLSVGTYPWSVAAYDTAGNTGPFGPTFSFQIVGPGLAVSKRADVSSSPVGGVIQYTYHVTNTGNVALTLQVVDDKLGPVTLALLPGGTAMLPATSLPAGGEANGTRSYTVKAGDLPGPLVNTVVVTGTSPSGQVITASASATVALEGASGDATVTVQPGQAATMSYTDPNGGKVTVQIPAGAVDQPTTFVYDNQATPSRPVSFQFAGRSFTLTAFRNNSALDGLTFLQPVTLVIEYTDADVAGIDENTLVLFFYDEDNGSWSQEGITVVTRDPANNRITLQITHLTEFALGAIGPIYLPLVYQ